MWAPSVKGTSHHYNGGDDPEIVLAAAAERRAIIIIVNGLNALTRSLINRKIQLETGAPSFLKQCRRVEKITCQSIFI